MKGIRPLAWEGGVLKILDQRLLPGQVVWLECTEIPQIAHAIRELAVRGAPAIGIAAAYGLALRARSLGGDASEFIAGMSAAGKELASTRPTAVNLFWAIEKVQERVRTCAGQPHEARAAAILELAASIEAADVSSCKAIGAAGAALLPLECTVMTHCNAGALATGGHGTALGVIRSAIEAGKKIRVYSRETRPLLQGSRLTVWELAQDGIDVTLLCDSAAASLMARGLVGAVVVGADRIAANGDTANKIGTLDLAVLARYFSVPFYVAAPQSTLDPRTAKGADMVIEERAADEVRLVNGRPITVTDIPAVNPAFDVTPADLITAIITERGVFRPPFAFAAEQAAGAGR